MSPIIAPDSNIDIIDIINTPHAEGQLDTILGITCSTLRAGNDNLPLQWV